MTPEISALIPQAPNIPGPPELMATLLFLTFVLHILMVNAVLGTVLITLFNLFRDPQELEIGRKPATVLPKGMALLVNLAIPPLLFIQALLGSYFYSASMLTALFWLAVPFIAMLAYYGLYIYVSPMEIGVGTRRFVLSLVALLLLFNSFLLVNNVLITQSPHLWTAYAQKAGGILINWGDPQIWPRWLHIVLSCLAVGGLSIALPAWLKLRNLARSDAPLPKQQIWLRRMQNGYYWFIGATLAQIPVGHWFLYSLPPHQLAIFRGADILGTGLLVTSFVLTGAALLAAVRRMIGFTVGLTVATVLCMVAMRTMLRVSFLEPYGPGGTFGPAGGPIWLFLGAALVTGVVVYRMCRAYRNAQAKEAV
jgi:hypothetical protein